MQDYDKYSQIDEFGENDEFDDSFEDDYESKNNNGKKHSMVPIIQCFACLIILLALIFLKYTNTEDYDLVTDWYDEKVNTEIELPRFAALPEESSSSAAAQSSEESKMGSDETMVQRV